MSQEPIAVYPAGTPIKDVQHFDRGTKVIIRCKEHPQWLYASKDPYVSNWFPADRVTADAECRGTVDCIHTLNSGTYEVAVDYKPTRDG
jgi:hypothetical protein